MAELVYDPFDPAVRRNPYPCYAALRSTAPVSQVPALGMWAVSRYDDVAFVLRRHDLFSSAAMAAAVRRPVAYAPAGGERDGPDPAALSIIGADPPDHTRLRAIVNRGFTPRRIAALEPRVREIATGLARELAPGECDLVADFAVPLPVTVIAELLGIDPQRRHDFKRWSDAAMRAVFDTPDEPEAADIGQHLAEMSEYLDEVMADRQRCPQGDLLSALLHAEAALGVLHPDEAKLFAFTLLVAGNVTTTHLIANGTLALLAHPGELARVTRDPALVPALVEEALRYDPPVQLLPRTATRDVELGGVTIPGGSLVAPLFGSANRDEATFAEPDRFDVTRPAREQLAFGHGIHFCLGAALARLEARIAFEVLLAIMHRPALAEEEVSWVESLTLRGPKRLRLRFEPARLGATRGASAPIGPS